MYLVVSGGGGTRPARAQPSACRRGPLLRMCGGPKLAPERGLTGGGLFSPTHPHQERGPASRKAPGGEPRRRPAANPSRKGRGRFPPFRRGADQMAAPALPTRRRVGRPIRRRTRQEGEGAKTARPTRPGGGGPAILDPGRTGALGGQQVQPRRTPQDVGSFARLLCTLPSHCGTFSPEVPTRWRRRPPPTRRREGSPIRRRARHEGEGATKARPSRPDGGRASSLHPGRTGALSGQRAQPQRAPHDAGPLFVSVPFCMRRHRGGG